MVLDVSPGAKVNFEQGEIEGRQDRVADPALRTLGYTHAEDGAKPLRARWTAASRAKTEKIMISIVPSQKSAG